MGEKEVGVERYFRWFSISSVESGSGEDTMLSAVRWVWLEGWGRKGQYVVTMWVECNFDDDCEHLDSLGQSALDGPTETTARVLMIENFEAADPQLYWEATFLYARRGLNMEGPRNTLELILLPILDRGKNLLMFLARSEARRLFFLFAVFLYNPNE